MRTIVIENAKKVALTSYSAWANYLGLICLVTPEFIYWKWGIDSNPFVWWSMALFLLAAGTVGRFITQPGSSIAWRAVKVFIIAAVLIAWAASAFAMGDRPVRPAAGPVAVGLASDQAFLGVAVPYVGKWEGLRLVAYKDIVGVWTVCYGETKGVTRGMSFSKAQCDEMFSRGILSYRSRIHRAFTHETKAVRLPVQRDVAYTSLAYNVGVSAISKSTAVRRLNAGDIVGGCKAIGWFNKAGGRVIRGLQLRRVEDVAKCMIGVAA